MKYFDFQQYDYLNWPFVSFCSPYKMLDIESKSLFKDDPFFNDSGFGDFGASFGNAHKMMAKMFEDSDRMMRYAC